MEQQPSSIEQSAPEPMPAVARTAAKLSDEALLLLDAEVPGRAAIHPERPPPSAEELRVEVVPEAAALEAIEAEWRELAAAALEPNPFYEPAVLLPALRAFAGGERVEVALVFGPHPTRAKGLRELCGLFPMRFRRGRAELWSDRYSYLAAPLVRRGCESAVLEVWLSWLAGRAALCRLDNWPGDGALHNALVDELNRRKWPRVVSASYTRALFRRAPSAEEYLSRALAGRRRKELRRQRARLGEQGRLELAELGPGEDPLPWIDELVRLESAGWKGRDGVATAAREADMRFLRQMAAQTARTGQLQMLALRLDRKAIAVKLNLHSGEGAFAFKIAFDESFSRYSPGVLLELDNIERAHRLPKLRWMDSCAAPNRFMINHLWNDRREMQTLFFSTGKLAGALQVIAVPALHLLRAQAARLGVRL